MRVRKAKRPAKAVRKSKIPRKREASMADQLLQVEREAKLLRLKSLGYSRAEIAKELGVDTSTVHRIWEKSYQEFIGDKNQLFDTKLAEIMARHEYMIRKWSKKAETNVHAANLITRINREMSKMCGHGGGNAVVVTSGGGSITTVNATPMEAARLVREAFGGKVQPYVAGSMPTSSASDVDDDSDAEDATH